MPTQLTQSSIQSPHNLVLILISPLIQQMLNDIVPIVLLRNISRVIYNISDNIINKLSRAVFYYTLHHPTAELMNPSLNTSRPENIYYKGNILPRHDFYNLLNYMVPVLVLNTILYVLSS